MKSKPIKVLIVDDSPLAILAFRRIISTNSNFEIVGAVQESKKVLRELLYHQPNVIIMDYMMPELNGAELTRKIMEEKPTPILIVTGIDSSERESAQIEVLKAGAVDIFSKKGLVGYDRDEEKVNLFLRKLKVVSGVPVFTRRRNSYRTNYIRSKRSTNKERISVSQAKSFRLIAIGASTGGPPALEILLNSFDNPFPLPIVLVQHIGEQFLDGFISWLDKNIKLKVMKATAGFRLIPGVVYVAPEDRHMTVDKELTVLLDKSEPLHSCRPSVDRLFFSLAKSLKERTVGVLLTGMGKDGAEGLKAMYDVGAYTIIQDKKTSMVFGMPGEAYKLKAYSVIQPIDQIADVIKGAIF